MSAGMRYLSASLLARINAAVGGDAAADEAVLARVAEQAHRAGLHATAAALLVGVAKEQPFPKRNRDAALVAVDVFYSENGWYLDAADGERLLALIDRAAEGSLSEAAAANSLIALVRPEGEELFLRQEGPLSG
jgi:prophage maintenance system killer protein